MKHVSPNLRSLSGQMMLGVLALVLLTAAAAGLPAIWLIRAQLEQQAWTQVEHGARAARALYAARQTELTSLATLTAQRPTLRDLLAQTDQSGLVTYLGTLQAGAGLDLLIVCDANRQVLAQVGEPVPVNFCGFNEPAAFRLVDGQVWLLAAQSLETGQPSGQVMVGLILDDEFAHLMHAQTGLEHNLLLNGQPVASSLPRAQLWRTAQPNPQRSVFTLEGAEPYYALSFPLEPSLTLNAEVALNVTDITRTENRLVWTLVGSMLGVVVVGSGLGIILARQISRPLADLTRAAAALSQGDLAAVSPVKTRVREVALVAQSLNRAHVDLQHTLTQLRHEKAWTDHLLEAIVEGIVTLDTHNRITFFSPGAERITGWPRAEVLRRPIDEIFHPLDTDKPFSQFIPPPGRRQKITVELAQGRQATLALTGAQLTPPETGEDWLAVVFRDVSEEDMMNRIMGHFLGNIAHEFRTPLSAVAASVELLLDQAPDLNADELQELLVSLHLGIVGLQTLVDNLLESASIESGRFHVYARSANLNTIIVEATRMMQPLLAKHGQRLILDIPDGLPPVRADSRRAVQVLVNLLSNASKYGPDEAEITVGVAVESGRARVSVADQGQGVAPPDRHDLFRRFAHPEGGGDKTQQYGAGLGLSVVKAIVEAQGGQVGVDDRPGGGLVFWFTVPWEGE